MEEYGRGHDHGDHRQNEGGLQGAPVSDPSHHRGRWHIAQNVDDENIYRQGGRPHVSTHRIDDRSVQGRGIQQKKKGRDADGRHHEPSADKQGHDHDRNAEGHAGGRNQVVRTSGARQQIVAEPPASERGQNPIHHDNEAKPQVRRFERIASLAVEKLRNPDLYAA
jgi:hypothetical protein